MGSEQRKDYRVPVARDQSMTGRLWSISDFQALVPDPPDDAIPLTVLNISAGGIAAGIEMPHSKRRFNAGDPIGLVLIRNQQRMILLQAEVRHQEQRADGSCVLGIRFLLDARNVEQQRLMREIEVLIADLQREQLHRRAEYGVAPPDDIDHEPR